MKLTSLALTSSLLLPSCSLLITPLEPEPRPPLLWEKDPPQTPLIVFSHGYHTGLTLPASALREELPELCVGLTDEWLEFGWGDEGFYRSEDITIPLVFSALFYPTPGVVHVTKISPPLHLNYLYHPIRQLQMNRQETQQLAEFLAETFRKTPDGKLIPLGPGRYGYSGFFRARDSYYFPRSCNSWTARGLQAAGHDVFALTAPGLMRQIPHP